jgi:hypothetical protein
MPSVSKKQHNLMEAVAHNPAFAKKVGIPRSVGEEFSKADKGKTFKKGGEMKKKMAMGGETMGPRNMSKDVEAGSNKKMKFGESAVQKKGHTKGKNLGDSGKEIGIEGGMKKGGKVKKMASGGIAKRDAHAEKEGRKVAKELEYDYKHGRKMMAKGGSASSRADGIAMRGKTVGKYC